MNDLSINEYDAISAMLFGLSLICVVRSGDACILCCLTASALRRWSEMLDVVVACLSIQVSVAILSDYLHKCVFVCC